MSKLLIVTAHNRAYKDFIRVAKLNPMDCKQIKNAEDIRGHSDSKFVVLDLPDDYSYIYDYARSHNFEEYMTAQPRKDK